MLEPGLDYAELRVPEAAVAVRAEDRDEAAGGDGLVRALRIDPERFELRLLMASAPERGEALVPAAWCARNGLVAAVNAGMYAQDHRTAVSLLKSRQHVNNPRLTRDQTVLVFDRLDETVPPAQIIDRQLQDFASLAPHYGSFVQGIRMLALDGRNVWSPQERRWSAVVAGIDSAGRVLLLHSRSPHPMHDLVDILRALPLGLRNLMYLEGGGPAQLCVRAGGLVLDLTGCYDSDGPAGGRTALPSTLPNIIGVARRQSAPAAR